MMFLEDYIVVNNQLVPKASIKNLQASCHEEEGVGEHLQIEIESNENQELDENATLALVEEYENHVEDFRNPKIKKKVLWQKIASVIKEKGYANVDGSYLDQKFRNMKSTYKKIKDNNKKTATGRGRVIWKYYDRFEQIFASDKTINIGTTDTLGQIANTLDSDETSSTKTSRSSTPDQALIPSNRLDVFRKRQLALEEEKLQELKHIRLEVMENNRINREKLQVLKDYCKNVK